MKDFDAVKMVREIGERHAEILKEASPEERIAFYQEQHRRLQQRVQGGPDALERELERDF